MNPINLGAFELEPVLFSGGVPSNFYHAEIILPVDMLRGKVIAFDTNEHFFQAEKVAVASQGTIDMHREIVEAASPMEAKRLGRLVPLDANEQRQWDLHYALVR
jgi:predicted NAD-dependent protein-ADP-ribosyltransferase YbiA (DUF1768 family)